MLTKYLRKRLIWLFVAGAAVAIFSVACSDDSTEPESPAAPAPAAPAAPAPAAEAAPAAPAPGEPKYGGSLKFTMFASTQTLDPPFLLATADIQITQIVYDNLIMIQPDLSLRPTLSTSWESSADLTSYTFDLRKGVKFHHGKEFKAEDVVFTFNRLLDPELDSPARTTVEVIENMEVLDDYKIRFDLASASAFFPDVLSIYQARIVPSDVDVDRLTLEEFGTGPFMISEHLPGERTVMPRFDDFWDEGRPYLDEVVLLLIPEPETRAEALKSGDVDVIHLMQPQSAPGIESHPETVVLQTASPSYINLAMDTSVEPFDNKLVRKALQAATDREAVLQAALLGRGSVAYDHPISPNDPHFASQYAPPPYDIDAAKELLKQAGYPDGVDLTLYASTASLGGPEMAVVMKERAAPAGFRIDIKQVPEDGFWSKIWLKEAFVTLYWNGRPPDQALSIVYMSDAKWNESKYFNPVVDELILKARGQADLEDRRETYGEIQRILIDDVPRIVIAFQPILFGARSDVRGIEAHPLNWMLLNDAWLDR